MTATDPLPPPPPGGGDAIPPPPGRPVRRTGDRVVAGVAAGLGRHFGIDPVVVRVLFVITTFAAGLGALAYLVLWLVLPQVEAGPPSGTAPAPRGAGFWIGAAVVTVAGIIALGQVRAPRVFIPLALVAIGVALWQRPSGATGNPASPGEVPGRAPASPPPPPANATASVATTSQPSTASVRSAAPLAGAQGAASTGPASVEAGSSGGGGSSPVSTPGSAFQPEPEIRWWVPPAPRPAPSWLGPIAVALALVATGVVAALGAGGVLTVRGSDLVAVALLVLAGGMVVGMIWGRAKWLALPASALAGLLVAMQLVGTYGVQLVPAVGENRVSATHLEGTMDADLAIGEVVADLSDAEFGPDAAVDVDLGVGRAAIIVPPDAAVRIRGRVGVGAVNWFVASGTDPGTGEPIVVSETVATGRDLDVDRVLGAVDGDGPDLRVDVAVGIGAVDVYRGYPVYAHERHGEFILDGGRHGEEGGVGFLEDATPTGPPTGRSDQPQDPPGVPDELLPSAPPTTESDQPQDSPLDAPAGGN